MNVWLRCCSQRSPGFQKAVQDTVNKGSGIFGAEALAQFHCFVYGHFGRDFRAMEQFKQGQSQNGAVNGGHAFQAPVFGKTRDVGIQLFLVSSDPAGQAEKICGRILIRVKVLPKDRGGGFFLVSADLKVIQALQGPFPGQAFSGSGHEFLGPDLTQEVDHFHGGLCRGKPLIAGLAAGPFYSLFQGVRGDDAKEHRHAGFQAD
jgi:hypothetical protein